MGKKAVEKDKLKKEQMMGRRMLVEAHRPENIGSNC